MPIYEFTCSNDHTHESLEGMETEFVPCPKMSCDEMAFRQISPTKGYVKGGTSNKANHSRR